MGEPVILVTGAARGIGRAVAERLFRAGRFVVGLDIEAASVDFELIECDASDWRRIADVAQGLRAQGRSVAGLVNNAAIQVEKTAAETTRDELDRVFAVNLFSIFGWMKELSDLFSEGASVVNIASVHSTATSPGIAAYAASKGGVVALTRALALEWGPRGVRVNAVSPGAIDTEMLRRGISRNHDPADAMGRLKAASPLKKVGSPDDVAALVEFLLSPDLSSNITGQEFITDSGVMARLASE